MILPRFRSSCSLYMSFLADNYYSHLDWRNPGSSKNIYPVYFNSVRCRFSCFKDFCLCTCNGTNGECFNENALIHFILVVLFPPLVFDFAVSSIQPPSSLFSFDKGPSVQGNKPSARFRAKNTSDNCVCGESTIFMFKSILVWSVCAWGHRRGLYT